MALVVIVGSFYTDYEIDEEGDPEALSEETEDAVLGAFEESEAIHKAQEFWDSSEVIQEYDDGYEGVHNGPAEGIRLYRVSSGKDECAPGEWIGEVSLSTGKFERVSKSA